DNKAGISMRDEKALLQQWKKDLQSVKEEKRKKKKRKKNRNQKRMNTTKLFEYVSQQRIYYKNNGVWKQKSK
ncbi:hypothetical protein, partial [Bacillus thuringiensis]|uniref:hypothetical protein n=1 Tax=Bacillus thuringiensis TaxID=1428 RepID=UPI0021B38319